MERSITNKFKNKNWKNKIEKLKIDPTLNWKKSEIIKNKCQWYQF